MLSVFFAADHRRNFSLCGPATGDSGYLGRDRILSHRGIKGYPEPEQQVYQNQRTCAPCHDDYDIHEKDIHYAVEKAVKKNPGR